MDAIAMTRELGKVIQQDPRFIRYAKIKLQNDNDKELQADIGEFNIVRLEFEREVQAEERNEEKLKEVNEKIRTIYSKIMATPGMIEYNTAKAELDSLVTEINTIISKSLEGEDPDTIDPASGCSGDCSSCGGSCG